MAAAPLSGSCPTLSVVTVSYECREHLLRCLDSLREAGRHLATEVVVVDNASTDGTVAAVRRCHPEVEVLASTRNRGFAWASNRGIERSTGRFILLLNPDTVVP